MADPSGNEKTEEEEAAEEQEEIIATVFGRLLGFCEHAALVKRPASMLTIWCD